MNFFEAINAHVAWKVRLQKHIKGESNERLDASAASRDDLCALGKWIYTHQGQYGEMPLFRQVQVQHADFHRCAAEIIDSVDRGEQEEAEHKLHHDYAHLSQMIVKSLSRLGKELPDEVV
ncbi:MAG TPA: CZB domain-containing protein [Gammaproteobacteria bacterium]